MEKIVSLDLLPAAGEVMNRLPFVWDELNVSDVAGWEWQLL